MYNYQPRYQPRWEDVESLAKNIAYKSEWKTRHLSIMQDDLVQESWIVFNKCANNGNTYENLSHFLTFFQTSLKNRIQDLIKYKITEKDSLCDYDFTDEEGNDYFENLGESKHSSDFQTKLSEAPIEIKDALSLILNLKIDRVTNVKLCSFLGYNPKKRDLISEIKTYLFN